MNNTIKPQIKQLLESVKDNESVLRYVYNNTFIEGVSQVLYSGPFWDNTELLEAISCLLTGKWVSSGEKVYGFERAFSKQFNQKHSVMVNSGSSANLVMLAAIKKVCKWEDGSEIIVSPVGFPTTIAPIVQNNLTPVFIDIEFKTLNFDVALIERKITNKTVAIFISPVLGNPPDMDLLVDIAKRHKLELILDGCDSLGSQWDDKHLSDYCLATSHSFYPAHHISTGEGGMVTSNSEEIVKEARSFAWWGRDCYCVGSANLLCKGTCGNRFDKWLDLYDGIVDHKYVFTNMGYNLKPMDLQGAIGLVQLEKFPIISVLRNHSFSVISELVKTYLKVEIPHVYPKAKPCWFGTPLIFSDKETKVKANQYFENNKIQTRPYFAGNILLHPGYNMLGDFKEYPNANKVLDLVFFLGASPHYKREIFSYIEKVLKKWTN